MLVHACGREHVLDAAVHTMPVPCPSLLDVHTLFPHLHHPTLYVTLPALYVVQSSWGQTGPVRVHRQPAEGEDSQEPDVPVFVLKTRPPNDGS